jgi:hypothetical protein
MGDEKSIGYTDFARKFERENLLWGPRCRQDNIKIGLKYDVRVTLELQPLMLWRYFMTLCADHKNVKIVLL